MCGISFYLSDCSEPLVNYNCQPRGPDSTVLFHSKIGTKFISLVFHRLAIVDVQQKISQPFEDDGLIWVVNGEIFNYKELIQKYNLHTKTNSDCEVLGKLYKQIGLQEMLDELDGDFAFILIDCTLSGGTVIFGRDRFGVRPLFYNTTENATLSIASEMKGLFCASNPFPVLPGYSYIYPLQTNKLEVQKHTFKESSHSLLPLETVLINAVAKRLECREQPIGFLLSGGLDSSLILSIACKLTGTQMLYAFTIGMEEDNSPDIEAAKTVVEYINHQYGFEKVHHTIFYFSKYEGLNTIPSIIYTLESHDVTTVRASVPMYLLVKKIKETRPDIRILFSGEGSDELFGGYLYFYYAPTDEEFRNETKKLVQNLHYYDVCRADRCVSVHGIELRVPFLDKFLVEKILSLSSSICRPLRDIQIEKNILRQAFKHNYLPNSVLWRTKAAFSDAVGYGWLDVVSQWCKNHDTSNLPIPKFTTTIEEQVFLYYFQKKYQKIIIPDVWVPNRNWIDTQGESSARVLH